MIVAFKLVKDNKFQEEGITDILMAPGKLEGNSGTRNLYDLRAQVAANNSGIRLLKEVLGEYGLKTVDAYMRFTQQNAEVSVRKMLKDFAAKNGNKVPAIDYMDDGTPIELTINIDEETGIAVFDFTGIGPQIPQMAIDSYTYLECIYSPKKNLIHSFATQFYSFFLPPRALCLVCRSSITSFAAAAAFNLMSASSN
jgi:5-oxoprolinase (ATP-hydrolysing)